MQQVTLSRDPFSRSDFIRELVPKERRKKCSWCGNREGRFRYGHARDGYRSNYSLAFGLFCAVGCYRSYHGG